jgi:hypothetical protein
MLRALHIAGRFGANQPNGYWIVQNGRLVHNLVGGAANGYAKGGLAGSAWLHLLQFK